MVPTSSGLSSTLSPLAPPFTVDHTNGAHRLQSYCYPPPSTAEFSGKECSPVKSVADSSSWMDPSLPYNSWPFHRGGAAESSMAYRDAYGAWHEKHVDFSARQVHVGADSKAGRGKNPAIYEKSRGSCNNDLLNSRLPNSNLVMNECETSKSSYDGSMSQLVSCSTDPSVYYPASTCSSSAELFAPANGTGSLLFFAPRNCYSTPQHGSPLYNVDVNYVDCGNKKETGINEYSDGKDGYVKEVIADDKMKENNLTGNSSLTTALSSLGNQVTTGNSMDHSAEVKYGFRKQWSFTEPNASSSRPHSSLQTSSEIFDQTHLAVDSPCWKGASVSQQYSFGGYEKIAPYLEMKESKGSANLDQGQKCFPVNDQYLRTSPSQEKDEDPACNVSMRGSLLFPGGFSPNISPHGTDKRFHDINAKGLVCAEVGGQKSHFSCVTRAKRNEIKDLDKDSEQVEINVKQSGEGRTTVMSANSLSLVGEGANSKEVLTDATQDKSTTLSLHADSRVRNFSVPGADPGQVAKPSDSTDHTGKCLTAGKDADLLIKAMLDLSEVLLSYSYDSGVEWEECDHELVQLVIDNLETFTCMKEKGITKCGSHASGNEPGQPRLSVLKSKKQSNTSTKDTEGKFHCAGSCMNSNKFDISRSNGIPQVSVKDLENDVFAKKEDNPQAVLYRNLWVQAEAALCSMKYELQLARMKLEMENYEGQTEAKKPVKVKKSPWLNFMQSFDAPVLLTQESLRNDTSYPLQNNAGTSSDGKPEEQKTNKYDKVDASVMARLEVLRGRYAR